MPNSSVVRSAPPRCGVPPFLWRVDVVYVLYADTMLPLGEPHEDFEVAVCKRPPAFDILYMVFTKPDLLRAILPSNDCTASPLCDAVAYL